MALGGYGCTLTEHRTLYFGSHTWYQNAQSQLDRNIVCRTLEYTWTEMFSLAVLLFLFIANACYKWKN